MNVPIEYQVWSGAQCAEYLNQAYKYFMRETQFAPGFPPRCDIPGHPRWSAKLVIEWATKPKQIPPQSRQLPGEARIY